MRGMMKWLPFKSLNGQYDEIERMKQQNNIQKKPELSEDAMEEINQALAKLKKGEQADIRLFQDGRIQRQRLTFLRCDTMEQKVFFKERILSFADLLSVRPVKEDENEIFS